MDRNKIIQEIKQEMSKKRHEAELKVDNYIDYLCQNNEFSILYTMYNQSKINLAKSKYFKQDEDKAKKDYLERQKALSSYIKEHNIDVNNMTPQYDCKLCEDTGIHDGKMCDCLRRKINERLSENSSTKYKYAKFEDSKNELLDNNLTKIYDTAKKWCNTFPKSNILNLNFLGEPGTGKTFLLECMASEIMKKGYNVVFITAFALNEECKKYHFSQPNSLDNIMTCDMLIIDDLGCEPILKNITIEYLFNIINLRQKQQKPTLISTNLSLEDILNRYDERIFSRISNKSISLTVQFTGKDKRLFKN